jgi:hypothetical protein
MASSDFMASSFCMASSVLAMVSGVAVGAGVRACEQAEMTNAAVSSTMIVRKIFFTFPLLE